MKENMEKNASGEALRETCDAVMSAEAAKPAQDAPECESAAEGKTCELAEETLDGVAGGHERPRVLRPFR